MSYILVAKPTDHKILFECACCFELFDSLQFCQFCGDPNTDDMTASYSFGCNHCDGSLGQIKDE